MPCPSYNLVRPERRGKTTGKNVYFYPLILFWIWMAKKETTVTKKTKTAAPKKAAAKKATTKAPAAKAKATGTKAKAETAKKATKPAKAAPADPNALLVEAIVDGILDKKGKDIVVMDLRPTGNSVTDWFIICHGTSNTHTDAIADSVEETVRKKLNEKPWHTEGFQNAEWILIDYVNVIVHVFQEHIRDFYRLEDLWADAPTEKIEESFGK